MAKSELELQFIESLVQRLGSYLPNRTGALLLEVELNPQFIISKNLLIDRINPDTCNYMNTCFIVMCKLIVLIGKDTTVKVKDLDDKTLSSVLIIIKVLTELVKRYWRSQVLSGRHSEPTRNHFAVLLNFSFYYYFEPPKPLNPEFITYFLDIFTSLVTGKTIKKFVDFTQKRTIDDIKTGDEMTISKNDTNGLLDDMDYHVEICLRFLAASNPVEYFNYLESKLFKYGQNHSQAFPKAAMEKYSLLIKFVFFTDDNGLKMARAISKTIEAVRSNTWRQIILTFYVLAIRDHSFSRPLDYAYIVESNDEVSAVCKGLFDLSVTVFEELPNLGVYSMVQSWLSFLNPSDYLEYSKKPNKLKVNFNKRLRFINNLLKDSQNKTNLMCFDSLINLYHLAGRFPDNLHNHPIYTFAMTHLDTTYENLMGYPNAEMLSNYESLVVNFYVSAIMLKPDKYVVELVAKFGQLQDTFRDVYRDMQIPLHGPLRSDLHGGVHGNVHLVVKIIRSVSEVQDLGACFTTIMQQIAPQLKQMSFMAARFLNQHYDVAAATPIHSDHASVASTTTDWSNDPKFDLSRALTSSGPSIAKVVSFTEDILADLFAIFSAAPELFFNDFGFMQPEVFHADEAAQRAKIGGFVSDNIATLKAGLQSKTQSPGSGSASQSPGPGSGSGPGDSELFAATCRLIMTIVSPDTAIVAHYNEVSAFCNFVTCNYIVKVICDFCLGLSLNDTRFKSNLIFLNGFLTKWNTFQPYVEHNDIIRDRRTHEADRVIVNAIERLLLFSLCTHDIQFYNIAKDTIKWYLAQSQSTLHPQYCFESNMVPAFARIVDDDFVFTGFVSLHKRFRSILRESQATKSLYQTWTIIFDRWQALVAASGVPHHDNVLLRHFTGFLVSTSGCFLLDDFANQDLELKLHSEHHVNAFFDACIELLNSQHLMVRVLIKDALLNESHPKVYNIISTKLIAVVVNFEENKIITEQSTLFTEQAIAIVTAMIAVDNDGAVVLTTLLPDICLVFIKVINLVDNPVMCDRLKLRFCKLVITIEQNRARLLLAGAHKIRNYFAKSMCDWLEQAAFFDEVGHLQFAPGVSGTRPRDSELLYLNVDLAIESSKALSLQLEELILDIPDGTSDADVSKYKDLAFANYFSLFYKILTKYTTPTPPAATATATAHPGIGGSAPGSSGNTKSKYKLQIITDNVLKCITNMLQYDTDVGLQFVFPLGYHENPHIRALFLHVFANMLYERKSIANPGQYSADIYQTIAESHDIIRAASHVASANNHLLFANAAYGVYGHVRVLDKVFEILIDEEINHVSRTSDIFRRNSILTKMLAKLARDEGIGYLSGVLKEFIEEFTNKDVVFHVDDADPEFFMSYLTRLVDTIVGLVDDMPPSFRFICREINSRVSAKVADSGLVAVGLFIFLRFFCPAIISPEQFFEVEVIGSTNKKLLLQLVKVVQNMANQTLSALKWRSLQGQKRQLAALAARIFAYLNAASAPVPATTGESGADTGRATPPQYPFQPVPSEPVAESRFFHKFFFTYYKDIKAAYLLGDFSDSELRQRVEIAKLVDQLLKQLGQPRHLLNMPNHEGVNYKSFDTLTTVGLYNEYHEFMTKMSAKYAETPIDVPVIHNSIFHDGTPVVVINLYTLKFIEFNVELLVYKLFETASQVWDNKFYFVFDFTGFSTEMHLLVVYATLLHTYAPPPLFKNCSRVYYFNIPVNDMGLFLNLVKPLKVENKETRARFYTYSHCDSVEIISSLCLSDDTMAITRDKKVEFGHCQVLDMSTNLFRPVTVRIGRQFLLLCSDEFVPTDHELCATKGFRPVELFSLANVSRCEMSQHPDEFTIYFSDATCVIRAPERLEILRFLYFTTSRLPKAFLDEDDKRFHSSDISNLWFGRLFNITFQSLLSDNDDVKASALVLFALVADYFDIDYQISRSHAASVAYPMNPTDFIVAISRHLAHKFPHMTYRFLRAYFDTAEKVPPPRHVDALLYVVPWIKNICGHIYLDNEQLGPDRVAGLVRHFCHISAVNRPAISVIHDYIWKPLFADPILVPTLLDEIVTFAMDIRNDDPNWSFIILVLTPLVELCGEVIKRLVTCVRRATNDDSDIASESKLFEIMILVKICSLLFFDLYVYAQLYLADVFFLCTLFIDNPSLEFGADLQKLVINTIESFLHKPELTEVERLVVEDTLTYFTGQRARMLFGLTRDKVSGAADISQLYSRAAGFETLCDYLNGFITVLGSADDRSGWRAQWSSAALDVAFVNSSIFQARAILVVGILSKTGINDQAASRMLKLMSQNSFNNTLEYMSTVLMSAARMFAGLAADSIFPPLVIWPQLYFGMLNYASLYQANIQCLLNTYLKNLQQGSGPLFVQRIFAKRTYLLPFIDAFEKSHHFHIDENNIMVYIFFIFTQGLKLSHIKHTSLTCLQAVFKFRRTHEPCDMYEVPTGIIPYFLFIWLSTTSQQFDEYLVSVGYSPTAYADIGKYRIPHVILDFLVGDSLYGIMTLYQGAFHYATSTVEEEFKNKFLYLYHRVFHLRQQQALKVYHIIKDTMEVSVVTCDAIETVQIITDIQAQVIANDQFSMQTSRELTDVFLNKYGLMIVKDYKFRKLSDLLAEDDNMKRSIEKDNERLQEMIYRSAAYYVESLRLEI